MTATVLDGNAVADEILAALTTDIERLGAAGRAPHLAAIRANDDPGSDWYAGAQRKHCETHGIRYTLDDLGPDADADAIRAAIDRHNADETVSAILLHMPLPAGVSQLELALAIHPGKDAEGIHPANLGRLLATGRADPAPCTAVAAVELVRRVRPELDGARALVMGRSAIVGKPAALLLLNLNASVTIGHSRSDVASLAKDAEVLIAATGAAGLTWARYRKALKAWREAGAGDGKPEPPDLTPLITKEMVRPGALVIDVGVNHVPKALDEAGEPVLNSKGRPAMQYVGDVDVESVKEVAGWVTSPKGGAGPVTNAYLLVNTVRAALRLAGLDATAA